MKVLSNAQVQQVSGGFSLGSLMSLAGMKMLGSTVHSFEVKAYDATLGKIPVLGPKLKGFFTDAFKQFK